VDCVRCERIRTVGTVGRQIQRLQLRLQPESQIHGADKWCLAESAETKVRCMCLFLEMWWDGMVVMGFWQDVLTCAVRRDSILDGALPTGKGYKGGKWSAGATS